MSNTPPAMTLMQQIEAAHAIKREEVVAITTRRDAAIAAARALPDREAANDAIREANETYAAECAAASAAFVATKQALKEAANV